LSEWTVGIETTRGNSYLVQCEVCLQKFALHQAKQRASIFMTNLRCQKAGWKWEVIYGSNWKAMKKNGVSFFTLLETLQTQIMARNTNVWRWL